MEKKNMNSAHFIGDILNTENTNGFDKWGTSP